MSAHCKEFAAKPAEKKKLGVKYRVWNSETEFFGKVFSFMKATAGGQAVQCSVIQGNDLEQIKEL